MILRLGRAIRERSFAALPANSHTRIVEPASDHLNAPGAAAPYVIAWMYAVLGR